MSERDWNTLCLWLFGAVALFVCYLVLAEIVGVAGCVFGGDC